MIWIGIVIGGAAIAVVMWLRNKGITVRWYEYLMGALAVVLVMAAANHYIGSLNEFEPTAAWIGALIFGLTGLILGAVAWQLISRRQRAG